MDTEDWVKILRTMHPDARQPYLDMMRRQQALFAKMEIPVTDPTQVLAEELLVDDEQDGSRYDDYSGVSDFTDDDEDYCQELLNKDALDDYNAECT